MMNISNIGVSKIQVYVASKIQFDDVSKMQYTMNILDTGVSKIQYVVSNVYVVPIRYNYMIYLIHGLP